MVEQRVGVLAGKTGLFDGCSSTKNPYLLLAGPRRPAAVQ
jgi:hypothetical protein